MTNNSFGHLEEMEVLGSGGTCQFSRNSITQWNDGSLATMASACRFQDNVFSEGCTCSFEWLDKLSPGNAELKQTSYCQIDKLVHCFNATTFNAQKYHQMLCGKSPHLDCTKTRQEKKVEANFLDPNEFAKNREEYEIYLYLLAGCLGLIVLLVIVVILLRTRCRGKPQRTEGNPSTTHQVTIGRQNNHMSSPTAHAATMNKGAAKTFSGHDRAIVDLALERLRVKHPREIFDQVDTYTRKLMTEPLSETEKVLTIGEIVRLLDECENIGDDFLAFTDLLYRHLDENNGHPTVPDTVRGGAGGGDPLYAEPGLMGAAPGTTILSTNLESDSHIYAEPNSAQQPLLKTEYSMPMDRSEQAASNLYADPVLAQNGEC